MNVQNTNSGLGGQSNHNAPGQNVNHGGDQIVEVNIGRDLVRNFTTTTSNPHKSLWDAIAGVGASHRAEQQYSRGECLEGTRIEVLRVIHEWRTSDSDVPPIFWLSGPAGVGKTAIAMTVAKSCKEDGLIESFFFFRSDPKRNNPSALMLAIAHGLGVAIPRLKSVMSDRITADPKILEATLEFQFRELVREPLLSRKVRGREPWWRRLLASFRSCLAPPKDPGLVITPSDPRLIIIDGLDECSNPATQLRILATIRDSYQHTPRSPLRFLICSRSESWIRQTFDARPLRDIARVIVLDKTFGPANLDIERYLVHELEGVRESPEYDCIEFPTPWPSQEDYDCLVKRSDGQFAYVATVIKFVRIPRCNPVKQLHVIINNAPVQPLTKSPYPELDNLYHVILTANPDHDMILTILAAILLLPHEEMDDQGRTQSPEWLGLLLGLSSGEVLLALQAMHSVLNIRSSRGRIRFYHASFIDYLFDQTRSGKFYIDRAEQQYVLAQRWSQALSRSRIREYSLDQLYEHPTSLLFTHWIEYFVSLSEPTPELLDDLGNVDISALFFCRLAAASLKRNDNSVRPAWYETFRPMVKWLSSSVDSTAGMLIKRFREQPNIFHLESEAAIDPEHSTMMVQGTYSPDIKIILCAVSIITSGYIPGRLEKETFRDGFRTLRVTGCYCHDVDAEPTTPYHAGHRTYQSACLRLLKEYDGSNFWWTVHPFWLYFESNYVGTPPLHTRKAAGPFAPAELSLRA